MATEPLNMRMLVDDVRRLHVNGANGYGPGDCHCEECQDTMDRLRKLGEWEVVAEPYKLYRCPKCNTLTDRDIHCYVKGSPLFPQTDDYTICERVEGLFVQGASLPDESETP